MSVKWGIMGTAKIATKVKRAIDLAEGAEAVAVASRDRERAERWAAEHEVPKAYGSYEELLEDSEIQAVYIPLPPTMHAEWALAAARAGKHVLSEKPLTMSVDEAVRVVQGCREAGVQLMDGVMWVHHERSDVIRGILERGDLGEVRRVTAAFAFNWGPEVPTQNIRARPELGGGSLGDLGYYCVRGILWALDTMPVRAFATARYANGVDIELSGLLAFGDGRNASFDCGFTSRGRSWLEIAGAQASLSVGDFVLPPSEDSSEFWISERPGLCDVRSVGPCVQEQRMIEHFCRSVSDGVVDSEPAQQALDTVKVCMALADSARSGKWVDVALARNPSP